MIIFFFFILSAPFREKNPSDILTLYRFKRQLWRKREYREKQAVKKEKERL